MSHQWPDGEPFRVLSRTAIKEQKERGRSPLFQDDISFVVSVYLLPIILGKDTDVVGKDLLYGVAG